MLAFVAIGAAVRAEGVVTKSDIVVEGRIIKENECGVLVEHSGMGLVTIPHRKILFVIHKDQTEDEARLAAGMLRVVTVIPAPLAPKTPLVPALNGNGTPPALPLPNGKNGVKSSGGVANESAAVAALKLFIDAQDRYHRKDWDDDKVLEYAPSLKGDWSLLETKAGSGDIQLIDKNFADAEGEPAPAAPARFGYRFKVLKAQGANAFGGAKSYLTPVNGKDKMTLGFAAVAYPASYPATGVNTFVVSNAGVIWKKDLQQPTPQMVAEMKEFNPDKTWVIVE